MLADARDQVTATLTAAGVDVVDDPRNLTPPGVLVGPPGRGTQTTSSLWAATVTVSVVGAPPGNLDALEWLMDTTAAALVALAGFGVDFEATSQTVAGQDCPAYLLSVPVNVFGPCP